MASTKVVSVEMERVVIYFEDIGGWWGEDKQVAELASLVGMMKLQLTEIDKVVDKGF